MIKKINFIYLFMIFFFFSFVIDSGGPLGVRYISIVLSLFIFSILFFTKNKILIFDKYVYNAICLFYLFICFGFFSAIVNDVNFNDTIYWLIPISFLFYFLAFMSYLDKYVVVNSYISSMFIFSLTIISFFIVSTVLSSEASYALLYFFDGKYGMFYMRNIEYLPIVSYYPNIYFQATLSLVPAAIFAYIFDRKFVYYVILFSLILALSRFGVFTVLLCVFIIKYNVFNNKAIFLIMFFTLPVVSGTFLYIYLHNYGSYTNLGTGISIRIGHLMSVFDSLDLKQIFYGMGPGSDYYTLGFEKVVDNIEVSQLEIIRKYGFIGFFIFHISMFLFVFSILKQKEKKYVYPLFSFYLVSFSNPTLLSFQLPILIAISLVGSGVVKREFHA